MALKFSYATGVKMSAYNRFTSAKYFKKVLYFIIDELIKNFFVCC